MWEEERRTKRRSKVFGFFANTTRKLVSTLIKSFFFINSEVRRTENVLFMLQQGGVECSLPSLDIIKCALSWYFLCFGGYESSLRIYIALPAKCFFINNFNRKNEQRVSWIKLSLDWLKASFEVISFPPSRPSVSLHHHKMLSQTSDSCTQHTQSS